MCECRVKREEDRIQKEMQEKEEEEARNLLAEARKRGSKVAKIKEGEKLDKRTVQVDSAIDRHADLAIAKQACCTLDRLQFC